MATLLRTDGLTDTLEPLNGKWNFDELGVLVGGYVQIVFTTDGRLLAIDEEGKLKRKQLNIAATRLYLHGRRDVIVGNAVLIDSQDEIETEGEPCEV